MQQKKKRRGMLGTLLLTAILVTAVFAYTSSINGLGTTPNVASGVQVLGDFNVDTIAWADDGGTNVTGVSFNIDPAASTVRVNADGTNWVPCTMSALNTHASCPLSLAATDVTQLAVFASS